MCEHATVPPWRCGAAAALLATACARRRRRRPGPTAAPDGDGDSPGGTTPTATRCKAYYQERRRPTSRPPTRTSPSRSADAERGHPDQARGGAPVQRPAGHLPCSGAAASWPPRSRSGMVKDITDASRGRRSRRSAARSPAGRSTASRTALPSRVGVVGFWYSTDAVRAGRHHRAAGHHGRVLRRGRPAQGGRHRADRASAQATSGRPRTTGTTSPLRECPQDALARP